MEKLPEDIRRLISVAGDISALHSSRAYLVGGFVRDLILGVPNLDLDIVVEEDGIKFAEAFADKLGVTLVRHKRFGTASLILDKHFKVDFSTARREIYPHPGCLPVVSAGSLRDDLFRRDFTINAMAIEISKNNFGKFIDFFAGREDLSGRRVRILHPLSFIDDPTRILRAIRFEQRYNFKIEKGTLKALKEAIGKGLLEAVSAHRSRDELILMLKEKSPIKEIKRMQGLTGFDFISPKMPFAKKNYALLESCEKEIAWFNRSYAHRRHLDRWLIYFMGLTESLGADGIEAICHKFALRKGEEKRVLTYKNTGPGLISELNSKKTRPARIFSLLEPLSYEVIIMLRAKFKKRNLHRHIEDFLEIYNGMRLAISGEDLSRLGLLPGPLYQRIFSIVLKAKLNGKVRTREEELDLINKLAGKIK